MTTPLTDTPTAVDRLHDSLTALPPMQLAAALRVLDLFAGLVRRKAEASRGAVEVAVPTLSGHDDGACLAHLEAALRAAERAVRG